MKTVRTHSKQVIIDVRGMIVMYLLLCVLTILFSKIFFSNMLQAGEGPDFLDLLIFFTIPVVLLILLVFSMWSLFQDIITRRAGSRFQIQLLGYFGLIVVFAAVPVTVITSQSATELARFWKSIQVDLAVNFAQDFALQTYSLQVERFENMVKEYDFNPLMASASDASPVLPEGIVGIQDFELQNDETWQSKQFLGEEPFKLRTLPALQQQVMSRELPRDTDVIRYMLYPEKTIVRVVSYHLGNGFDAALQIIEIEKARFEIINALNIRITPLLIFYYGVFFFPTLLMTLIIAISLTKRVSYPLVELTEATRKVAEGDFSIHIVARRNDELGLLIRSFNTMVRDLEKSQVALVKAEKISIWQNMAEQLAHEIKNPLTPIKLSAERVLRRWRKEPERIHEILETCMMDIIQITEGLSTLLTEFRTLSRPMEPSLSWTSLQQLTEETVAPYRSSYPKVQFNIGHIEPSMVVKIDRQRLSQVLTNLIINGIDAMNGSGIIEIRTDLVKKWENQYCRLSISDTGKGITKQDSSQIFTPYFTTKASGTGLGLSIVERIVNEHGGTIWFNSAEGMGTTFFIDLPLQKASAAAESSGEAWFDPVSEQEGKGVQEKA